jgi:hypothetical protein
VSHYVLIQEPRREGVYVKCKNLDQCMAVVGDELKTNLPGTRVTMFRKDPRQTAELLAIWHIEKGGARRYMANASEPTDVARVEVDKVLPWPGKPKFFYHLTATTADGRTYKVDALYHESSGFVDVFRIKRPENLRQTGITTKVGRKIVKAVREMVSAHRAAMEAMP